MASSRRELVHRFNGGVVFGPGENNGTAALDYGRQIQTGGSDEVAHVGVIVIRRANLRNERCRNAGILRVADPFGLAKRLLPRINRAMEILPVFRNEIPQRSPLP